MRRPNAHLRATELRYILQLTSHLIGSYGWQSSFLAGPLPDDWGRAGAFPVLGNMTIQNVPLDGTLPASWSVDGAFPALLDLEIGSDLNDFTRVNLYGTLPAEWGQATALPKLELLRINYCNLTGVRAYGNTAHIILLV